MILPQVINLTPLSSPYAAEEHSNADVKILTQNKDAKKAQPDTKKASPSAGKQGFQRTKGTIVECCPPCFASFQSIESFNEHIGEQIKKGSYAYAIHPRTNPKEPLFSCVACSKLTRTFKLICELCEMGALKPVMHSLDTKLATSYRSIYFEDSQSNSCGGGEDELHYAEKENHSDYSEKSKKVANSKKIQKTTKVMLRSPDKAFPNSLREDSSPNSPATKSPE